MTRSISQAAKILSPVTGPTIPQVIRNNVDVAGGFRFILPHGEERSYDRAQLNDEFDRRGQHLLALGLKKGDRVGLILPSNEEFVITFMGALAVGVVPVPMYPPLSMGKLDAYVATAEHILDAAKARALITQKKVQSVLWSLVDRVESLDAIYCTEDMAGPAPGPRPDVSQVKLEDVAFLQFTSGSTSLPKGVVVTHQNLIANSWAMMHDGLEVGDDDQGVSWLPLYHDMGLIGCMLAPLWCGLPMVFIPTVSFVKHPTLWMETVHRFRGTLSYAPNFAYALARRRTPDEKLKKLDLSCLKALGAAAEPNHPDTLRAFVEFFGRAGLKPGAILPSYGMAEATLAMTFCPMGRGLKTDRIVSDAYHSQGKAVPAGPEEPKEKVLEYVSCGSPFPSHRLKIVGEDGRELPERSMGEIVFGGPSVTAGYFEREEATREVFTEAGLHTGDLGYVADGELYVTGRKKDIIILNGRNYDPQTVEWEAAEVPGVRKGNVVAFSRPGVATEELVVVAEAKEGQALGDLARAVKLRIQENLFLTVTDVRLIGQGQLPKTTSGKLQRRRTREQYLEGTLGSEGVRTVGGRAEKLMLAKHLGRSMMARFRHGIRQRADVLFSALNGSERDAPAAEGREDGPEEHER